MNTEDEINELAVQAVQSGNRTCRAVVRHIRALGHHAPNKIIFRAANAALASTEAPNPRLPPWAPKHRRFRELMAVLDRTISELGEISDTVQTGQSADDVVIKFYHALDRIDALTGWAEG